MLYNDKYLNDYKIEIVKDKNGKLVEKAEYVGPLYLYKQCNSALKKWKRIFLFFTVAMALCWLGVMAIPAAESRSVYIMLPVLCCSLPIYYTCDSVVRFIFSKAPLTREQYDKISIRPKKILKLLFALHIITLIALLIFYLSGNKPLNIVISILFTGLILAQALIVFFMHQKAFVMECSLMPDET